MIGDLISLLMMIIWAGGLLRVAPRLAAREAAQRGHLHVQHQDAVLGVAQGFFWPLFILVIYAQRHGEIQLGQDPEVRMQRSLEAQRIHQRELKQAMQSSEELDQLLEES